MKTIARSVIACIAVCLAGATTAEPAFQYGPSDADTVGVISGEKGMKNLYWWNHPNLTVTVKAGPNVDAGKLQAIHDAIGIWSATLATRLPPVSLTDVTGTNASAGADIVVHYVPHSGGVVNGGMAACGSQKCLNIQIRSEEPPGGTYADFDALRVLRETLHEIGHALGLDHAGPLLTSRDIMGYGWAVTTPNAVPIISDCDIAGIRAAFGWLFESAPPHPSSVAYVVCDH